ncbi:response regulator, partial [bacterium AH-315-P07]|nr:response regulator [bacterium AH-315-P07]
MTGGQISKSRNSRALLGPSLGRTLLGWFLFFALIPLGVVSWITYNEARNSLEASAVDALNSTAALKAAFIDNWFQHRFLDLEAQASSTANGQLLSELGQAFRTSNKPIEDFVGGYRWESILHERTQDLIGFRRAYEYYDLLLIDEAGNILYSVVREPDLGTNLFTGPYSDSQFAQACRLALETGRPVFSDFEFYAPSDGALAGFLTSVVVDEDGNRVGLFAMQIPIDKLDEIMSSREGLGRTGETYLVGLDGRLRSTASASSILDEKIETEAVERWIQSQSDGPEATVDVLNDEHLYLGPNGIPVLGFYKEIRVGNVFWALISEIQQDEAFAATTTLGNLALIVSIATIFSVLLLVIPVSRQIVGPLKALSEWVDQLATGKLSYADFAIPRNEIGDVQKSLTSVVDAQKRVAEQANIIAGGDFGADFVPLSDEDELGIAVNQMITNMREIVDQATRISEGDYSENVETRSEKDRLGRALVEMTITLRAVAEENQKQDWLKSGAAELAVVMRSEDNIDDLASGIVGFLCKYIDTPMGALYVINGDSKSLRLAGSFALTKIETLQERIAVGEGLVGQVASEEKLLRLSDLPDDYITIGSALGRAVPKSVLAMPFLHDGQLRGVIELASFNGFSDQEITFLENVADGIAIAFSSAFNRDHMQTLLHETEAQTAELKINSIDLQKGQEELRASNEELEQQGEELRASNEELEEKTEALEQQQIEIQERTLEVELARDELEKRAKELEQASRYKSEFLANMSHELRTPLNSLLILAKLLSGNDEGNLTEDQVNSMNIIYKGGQDLLFLINEILDLSKVEAGMLEIHHEEIFANALADGMHRQFDMVAEERGLTFVHEIANDFPETFHSDGQRLEQIIRNFLSNAFKFTAEGSVVLRMAVVNVDTDFRNDALATSTVLSFSAIDTGAGIPSEKLDAIFEAFQQADGSTSREYGGTGLGLSISRALADLLGGEIQVESEEQTGSTFTLFIPLDRRSTGTDRTVVSPTDNQPKRRSVQQATVGTPAPIEETFMSDDRDSVKEGDRTVLIIEDDIGFAETLFNHVRKRGFKCLIAGNGTTGLKLAATYLPSAILLDLGLPDMDGSVVLDRLKFNLDTRHIPVSIMSARDKTLEIMRKGAIGYLTKPFEAKDIEESMSNIEDQLSSKRKAVLLVEDDRKSCEAIQSLLATDGVEITVADTGAQALKYVRENHYDCIILDIGLPDISGFELLEKLEKDSAIEIPPIVVYTGMELSAEDLLKLSRYTTKIVVKGAHSPELLLDETSLFLHTVEASLPKEQQKMLRMLHDPDKLLKNRRVLLVDDDLRNSFA